MSSPIFFGEKIRKNGTNLLSAKFVVTELRVNSEHLQGQTFLVPEDLGLVKEEYLVIILE